MALLPLPMRCFTAAPLVLTLAMLLIAPARTVAHNGEPIPSYARPSKAPADLRNIQLPPRFSWLHWWEANRDRFLVTPGQDDALQPAEAEQLGKLRAEASAELLKAIEKSPRPSLTIEAALALGKMRHEAALPTLAALANKGTRPDVRRAAIVAIGLIGSAAAEKALVELNAAGQDERVAQVVGLGLMPQLESATLRQLRSTVTRDVAEEKIDKVGTSSVLTWSLRHQKKDDNLVYFQTLLRSSRSPWVASDALLGLGGTKDREAQRLLEETMFGTVLHEVTAYENLQLQVEEKARRFGTRGAQEVRDETGERDRDQLEAAGADAGPEVIAMSWLRSSAAIALGELDVPRAGEALLRFLDEDTKRHPSYETPMGFAIMSLAAYPTEESRDKLITILGKNDPAGKMRLDVPRDAPRRGFAALALGLYARPEKTEQGLTDRPKFDWAITTLAERLDDDREEEEVRTACAVGLGLTQRADVLPMLQKTGAKLEQRGRRGDQAVLGFIFLGRALAGDKSHIDIAGKFILGKDDVTPSGILARRATVLSLGLTRSATTIPVLTKAWHLNHYVNREVILALRLVGGANAATPVMERLRQAKDPEERAYMADALGELLAVERPTAMSRLTAGSNYTVRNDYLLPHQSLANGFLFDYLIASLGEK